MAVRVLTGDCRDIMRTMDAESVDCIVTSPPYWGLRYYGIAGQLGLEASLGEHIATMVDVFNEARRVLKKSGTCWINYGDVYAGSINGRAAADTKTLGDDDRTFRDKPFSTVGGVLKPKDLCMAPARLAIALQEAGWWLRSEIIWHKPNPMPESTRDRPTSAHEKIYLLAKSERYFYDAEAIAEPSIYAPGATAEDERSQGYYGGKWQNGGGVRNDGSFKAIRETRNKRNVWTIPSQPFSWGKESVRRVRVASDAPDDGKKRITSPDCPIHGDRAEPASMAFCDEHGDDASSHNGSTDNHPDSLPLAGFAPIDQRHEPPTAQPNLNLPDLPYSASATRHNNESHRTDLAPATSSAYSVSAQNSDHIPDRSGLSELFDSAGHTPENSSGQDGSADHPLAQIHDRIASKCTCEHYIEVTEKVDHFATFPPALIEPCILAGCPAQVCAKCGKPWARQVERTFQPTQNPDFPKGGSKGLDASNGWGATPRGNTNTQTFGWSPSCHCKAGTVSGTVLDPFGGAGTTGLVADRLGRNAILIELNPTYAAMAMNRVADDLPLFAQVMPS